MAKSAAGTFFLDLLSVLKQLNVAAMPSVYLFAVIRKRTPRTQKLSTKPERFQDHLESLATTSPYKPCLMVMERNECLSLQVHFPS